MEMFYKQRIQHVMCLVTNFYKHKQFVFKFKKFDLDFKTYYGISPQILINFSYFRKCHWIVCSQNTY